MRLLYIALIASLVSLVGCAGSANHRVLVVTQDRDKDLSCDALDREIDVARNLISEVNKDKSDLNEADDWDMLLWLPLWPIAKTANYHMSEKTAEARIGVLEAHKIERGCYSAGDVSEDDKHAAQKLREIALRYDNRTTTFAHYQTVREEILSSVKAPQEAQVAEKKKRMGLWAYEVEKLAKEQGCLLDGGSDLLAINGAQQTYRVDCTNTASMIVQCDGYACRISKGSD